MEAVFNTPMLSVEMKQAAGISFLSRCAGNPTDDFCCGFVELDLGYFTADTEDLSHMREIEVSIELGACPDLPDLEAAVPLIDGLVLRGEKR